MKIGQRIRYTESQAMIDRWRRGAPDVWHPPHGATGTVIKLPNGMLGVSGQIRWDEGPVTWLGSGSRFEVIS